jgi:hypothetical protein
LLYYLLRCLVVRHLEMLFMFLDLKDLCVRNERGMEEAERWLKHQHKVYFSGKSPIAGDPNKRAGDHSHLQTWSTYRRVVWRGNPTGWEKSFRVVSTTTRES